MSQGRSQGRIRCYTDDCFPDRIVVLGVNIDYSIASDLGKRCASGSDDGTAARHGLHDRKAEAFMPGNQEVCGRGTVQRCKLPVGHEAKQVDGISDAEVASLFVDGGDFVWSKAPSPSQTQPEVGTQLTSEAETAKHAGGVLAPSCIADIQGVGSAMQAETSQDGEISADVSARNPTL